MKIRIDIFLFLFTSVALSFASPAASEPDPLLDITSNALALETKINQSLPGQESFAHEFQTTLIGRLLEKARGASPSKPINIVGLPGPDKAAALDALETVIPTLRIDVANFTDPDRFFEFELLLSQAVAKNQRITRPFGPPTLISPGQPLFDHTKKVGTPWVIALENVDMIYELPPTHPTRSAFRSLLTPTNKHRTAQGVDLDLSSALRITTSSYSREFWYFIMSQNSYFHGLRDGLRSDTKTYDPRDPFFKHEAATFLSRLDPGRWDTDHRRLPKKILPSFPGDILFVHPVTTPIVDPWIPAYRVAIDKGVIKALEARGFFQEDIYQEGYLGRRISGIEHIDGLVEQIWRSSPNGIQDEFQTKAAFDLAYKHTLRILDLVEAYQFSAQVDEKIWERSLRVSDNRIYIEFKTRNPKPSLEQFIGSFDLPIAEIQMALDRSSRDIVLTSAEEYQPFKRYIEGKAERNRIFNLVNQALDFAMRDYGGTRNKIRVKHEFLFEVVSQIRNWEPNLQSLADSKRVITEVAHLISELIQAGEARSFEGLSEDYRFRFFSIEPNGDFKETRELILTVLIDKKRFDSGSLQKEYANFHHTKITIGFNVPTNPFPFINKSVTFKPRDSTSRKKRKDPARCLSFI